MGEVREADEQLCGEQGWRMEGEHVRCVGSAGRRQVRR